MAHEVRDVIGIEQVLILALGISMIIVGVAGLVWF
ncbi:uncharacterized protein Nmag_0370 [Natrialba magadii ATCC 43099]|uniref:Uncharacterized protein n=1 Tax=Natrialba magadii (strain ATCC 43099 / DSM 3394 / CCM 3739 / CIP 104546 / IAM 13178 / JCM 8861 / NBRC 102185 / NCIMB 2190 / MS3) TaxID=547559 RepID=D3SXS0_NATMM|nr:uncharacterized protein Nmag_0370 [Natrialba magadii ATCC 43099]ELY33620.1 hypothetical protein C500_02270 [Natrialba magadii ATCC 43099]